MLQRTLALLFLLVCNISFAQVPIPNDDTDPSEVQQALQELSDALEKRFQAIENAAPDPGPTPTPNPAPTIHNLTLEGGVYDGEPRPTWGYNRPGDCEGLLFVWDESSEEEPNGYDAEHPGTVICPETHEGQPGRWLGQVLSHTNVRWFGATDGGTGQERYIQAAADSILEDSDAVGSLYIPAGFYVLDGPIVLHRANSQGVGQFFSMEVYGDGGFPYAHPLAGVSHLHCSHNDTFAIGAYKAKGLRIRNLSIQGRNTVTFPTPAALFEATDEEWVVNGCRDEDASPYSGIVLDCVGRPSARNMYPGLEHLYHPGNGGGGSTDIKIEECRIAGFVAGIILSPTGTTQNCEQVEITRTRVEQCKIAHAVCQLQNRSVSINHTTCWGNVRDVINTSAYGEGGGQLPFMEGGNFAGAVKQLFVTAGNVQQIAFDKVFCESIYRIGDIGSNVDAYFAGCMFKFSYPIRGYGAPRHVMSSKALQLTFYGCTLIYSANPPNTKSLGVDGIATFDGCLFDTLPHHPVLLQPLTFRNCGVRHMRGIEWPKEITTGGRTPLINTLNGNRRPMGPAQVFVSADGTREFVNQETKPHFLAVQRSPATVNVDQEENTATFITESTNLQVGDVLMFSETGANMRSSAVRSIDGQLVTVEAIDDEMQSGEYFLYIHEPQVFRTPALGDLTQGSNIITNVLTETQLIRQCFSIGNRITIPGLERGAYVVAYDEDARTITMSSPALKTEAKTLLTHCKMRVQAYRKTIPISGVWPAGTFIQDTTGRTKGWKVDRPGGFNRNPDDMPLFSAL